jgi:hypothetical protein
MTTTTTFMTHELEEEFQAETARLIALAATHREAMQGLSPKRAMAYRRKLLAECESAVAVWTDPTHGTGLMHIKGEDDEAIGPSRPSQAIPCDSARQAFTLQREEYDKRPDDLRLALEELENLEPTELN